MPIPPIEKGRFFSFIHWAFSGVLFSRWFKNIIYSSGDPLLPFLPWLNSAQVFCARPEYIEFNGGQGIRYLTAFAQDYGSTTDNNIFYTFQGLSDDGKIYLSAVFPVRTGVFPAQPAANFDMVRWQEALNSYLEQIQAAGDESFDPPLDGLDNMVKGITVRKQ